MPLSWIWLVTAASLLGFGCAAQQTAPRWPAVPTAIVYDRDRDTWHVETETTGGESPRYPETVPIFTEEDGKRHEGLIPPAKYRMLDRHGALHSWNGPVALRHHDGFWRDPDWRIQRIPMKLPLTSNPDEPIDVLVYLDSKIGEHPPRYGIHVTGRGIAR